MQEEKVDYATLRRVVALTIAGSDSGGNAGVQADLRAFQFFGVHGCSAFSSLTAQNPFGVRAIHTPEPGFVAAQLDAVTEAYDVKALKTGMLPSAAVIDTVAGRLALLGRVAKVMDPVMVATSGALLMEAEAVDLLDERLLPLATLVTPNLPEAEVLLARKLETDAEVAAGARALADRYGCAVLVKGGHREGAAAADVLFDGERLLRLATPRLEDALSTHGTGCSLSAAVTAALACGKTLLEAVREAKAYVYESIRTGMWVGEAAAAMSVPETLPLDVVEVEEWKEAAE